MNYLEYENYLQHHGVKGMKWGVRRTPQQLGHNPVKDKKSLTKQVKKAHTLVGDAEKYQGRANAALQASKGHQLLSNQARNAGDKKGERYHKNKSDALMKEHDRYDDLAQTSVSNFLKTKASALYGSAKVENGKKYVDSLAGLNIKVDNIDRYEQMYKRDPKYSEGYNAESQHVKKLKNKSGSNTQAEARKSVGEELKRNDEIMKKYVAASKITSNPAKNPYYKSVDKSNEKLTRKTEEYLSTLDRDDAKRLIKRDTEHGNYYVDRKVFDPSIDYDDYVSISDDFAKRYR